MANWFEYATLSLHVYRGNRQPSLPSGWRILVDCPPELQRDGYFGSAYIKKESIKSGITYFNIVIAHRGSIPTAWDLYNDFLIAIGDIPNQYENAAKPFVEYVKSHVADKYASPSCHYEIEYTGHSLGAILAELCAAQQFNTPLEELAITFESPGSRPIIQSMEKSGKLPAGSEKKTECLVHTALADVNAINTCHEQIGKYTRNHFMPCKIGYDYDPNNNMPERKPGRTYYFLEYTIQDQHHMVKMYNYWKQSKYRDMTPKHYHSTENITDIWPVGFETGYEYYLHYEKRYEYWDGYMQYYWNHHEKMHTTYDDNYSKWCTYFVDQLMHSPIHREPKSSPMLFNMRNDHNLAQSQDNEPSQEKINESICTLL